MKRIVIFLYMLLCLPAFAQTTIVTGTIPNYAAGGIVGTFQPQGGSATPPTVQNSMTLSGTGFFSMRMPDNLFSTYKPSVTLFNLCSKTKPSVCYPVTLTITGTTQDISSAFTNAPIPPNAPVANPTYTTVTTPVIKSGTAANTDVAFEVLLSHTTGTASYTTANSYQSHPICGQPAFGGTATAQSTLQGFGIAWTGTAGSTWTVTYSVVAPPAADTPLDVVCIARN